MRLTIADNTVLGAIDLQEAATELGAVVVEGQAVIQKVDRQVLLRS